MAAKPIKNKKKTGKASTAKPAKKPAAPKKPGKKRVTITLQAPQAQAVHVTGTFCDWQLDSHPMKKDSKGTWKTTLSLPPGHYEYRFLVDGNWQDDPNCEHRLPNSFGSYNCLLQIPQGK